MEANRVASLADSLATLVNTASEHEFTRIIPNCEIISVSPGTLPANYITVKNEDGAYIPALRLAGMTYVVGEFVNILQIRGAEAVAFQHGSASTNTDWGKFSVSSNDDTKDYAATKLVAGAGVTLTVLNPGDAESLEIASAPEYTPEQLGRRFMIAPNTLFLSGVIAYAGDGLSVSWADDITWLANTGERFTIGAGSVAIASNESIIYANFTDAQWDVDTGSVSGTMLAATWASYVYSPNHVMFGITVTSLYMNSLWLVNGIKLFAGESYDSENYSSAYVGDSEHLDGQSESAFLRADGTRDGSSSQSQSFGATGIKADMIAESTAAAGVTVDGLAIKDGAIAALDVAKVSKLWESDGGAEALSADASGNLVASGALTIGNISQYSNVTVVNSLFNYNDLWYRYSYLGCYRARGTLAAPTDVIAGDYAGAFNFYGRYTGTYHGLANVVGVVDTATGSYLKGKLLFGINDGTTAGSNGFGFSVQTAGVVFGVSATPLGRVSIIGKDNMIQLVVKGFSGQTANLQEWQNSTGTALAYVDKSGMVKSSGQRKAVVTKTSSYTATVNDEVIICNGASVTITLPAATGTGQQYIIKNINAAAAMIDGNGAETIDGAATKSLAQWESATIIDYGSGVWAII